MIRIARLTIPQDSPQSIVREARAILDEALAFLGLELSDISIEYRDWKTDFGNFVIVPVKDNPELRRLADHFGPHQYFAGAPDARIDLRSAILTEEDLAPLEVGERVSGIVYDLWGADPFEGSIVEKYQRDGLSAVLIQPNNKKKPCFIIQDGQRAEIQKESSNE